MAAVYSLKKYKLFRLDNIDTKLIPIVLSLMNFILCLGVF
jgi:hypothetical protein